MMHPPPSRTVETVPPPRKKRRLTVSPTFDLGDLDSLVECSSISNFGMLKEESAGSSDTGGTFSAFGSSKKEYSFEEYTHKDEKNMPFSKFGDSILEPRLFTFEEDNELKELSNRSKSVDRDTSEDSLDSTGSMSGILPSEYGHYQQCSAFSAREQDSRNSLSVASYSSLGTPYTCELESGCSKSPTPFGWDSPYGGRDSRCATTSESRCASTPFLEPENELKVFTPSYISSGDKIAEGPESLPSRQVCNPVAVRPVAMRRPTPSKVKDELRSPAAQALSPGHVADLSLCSVSSITVPTAHLAAQSKTRLGRKSPRVRKGLKFLSQKICEKLREVKVVSPKYIIDMLCVTVASENDAAEGRDLYDKSVRRRIYDTLNVLVAVGLIRKVNNQIRWNGADRKSKPPQVQESPGAVVMVSEETRELSNRVEQKEQVLLDTADFLKQFKDLVNRNKALRESASDASGDAIVAGEKINLPFVLVTSSPTSKFEIKRTPIQSRMLLSCNERVGIYNDFDVMKAIRKSVTMV